MIYVLTMLLAAGIFYVAGAAAYGHFKSGGREARKELAKTKAQLRIATGTLRKIANNVSGAPELDAVNALDDIDNHEIKELN